MPWHILKRSAINWTDATADPATWPQEGIMCLIDYGCGPCIASRDGDAWDEVGTRISPINGTKWMEMPHDEAKDGTR